MIGSTNAGGGGGAGGTLTVSGVAGHTVTATKDGKTFSRTLNSSGTADFKGLSTGEWSLTMAGDGQTASSTVVITVDYSVAMKYFAATISVTYPATSTCVIKNSSGTQVASDTNTGSSAKTWTATVGASGTYTVTATSTSDSSKTKSTTISITADGQSTSVTITYELLLFSSGTDNTSVTGGWSGTAKNSAGISDSKLGFSVNTDTSSYVGLTSNSSIDVTNYSTLKATVDTAVIRTSCTFGLADSKAGSPSTSVSIANGKVGDVSVDISNVTGTKYITAYCPGPYSSYGYVTLWFTKVWLE